MAEIEKVEFVPLNISDEALTQVPNCHFITCEHDVLKNDADIMHARLQKLGKSSKLVNLEGIWSLIVFFFCF